MKILSVGAELVHGETETYTNGRIDIKKAIVSFRKFVNAPINKYRRRAKQKEFFNKEFGENWTLKPYAANVFRIKKVDFTNI